MAKLKVTRKTATKKTGTSERRWSRCANGRGSSARRSRPAPTLMERTDNLLVRQVMEIIRNDSVQHHRVQQFIIDS